MASNKVFHFLLITFTFALLFLNSREVDGAPFLLGNQMTALSVIPKTEEQARSLLDFLKDNPQYGANSNDGVQVNAEELILVPTDDVPRVSNGLQDIGLRLSDSSNTYQVS